MKPYYDEDGIQIFHGDCREIAPVVSADVMLTDPPYGVGKAEWDKEFVLPPPIAVSAIGLMPGLRNLLCCPTTLNGLSYKWTLAAHLVNGMTRGAIGFGNWIACVLYGDGMHSLETDCQEFAVGLDPKPNHPSPKPLNVVRWFLSRLPDGVVVDPFAGSGTTLLAAKNQGRRAIGIEIEERYCEIAAKRLAQKVLPLEVAP